jgi:hypothetical protein
LALIRVRSNWIDFLVGGGNAPTRNPKGNSMAWFSTGGDFVAWWILNSATIRHACPGSIAVASRDGQLLWQLPGEFRGQPMIQAMGVSREGKRVALCAARVTGQEVQVPAGLRDLSLQWVDMSNMKVVQLEESLTAENVASISWSPSGNSFVFDRTGRIFIHDLASGRTRGIADGRDPTWSPDEKQVALRGNDGRAVVIDPTTLKVRDLLGDRMILSPVQWSPDSNYVVVTEPASATDRRSHADPTMTAITRIYRLKDMSSVVVDTINIDSLDDRGRWWSWILDYRSFLQGASRDLPLRCRQQ